jgi:hypothetical protein
VDRQRIARLAVAPPLLSLLYLICDPGWAGAYKCRGEDGQVSYQGTPCPTGSPGEELTPDTAAPSGRQPANVANDYSVAGQLKALESAQRKARKERERDSTDPHQSDPHKSRAKKTKKPQYDAARCAKQRAESARWRREVKNGYLDRDQKEQEEQTLKYHEALVARYCKPEP